MCRVRFVRDGVLHVPGVCRRRAIRSRRSRSFTRGRALWHSASVCSAAICTARTVRTGSRRRRFVIRRRSLPARRRSQDAGRGSRAARRARGRQHLQRAADYERWGVEIFARARRGAHDRIRLERQRHAARWSFSAPGLIYTRSISRASTTSTIVSSEAGSNPFSKRFGRCTRWGSGWRSSRC